MDHNSFRAGAANVTITPPLGVELAGYGFGLSVGVLDDLEAQTLYLESGDERVVIVTVDLLAVGAEFLAGLRQRAEAEIGVRGDCLLVAASHSHSAPTARSLRQWGQVDASYLRFLGRAILQAIETARNAAADACLGWGEGHLETISQNRRAAGGPIDPAVPVLTLHRRTPPRQARRIGAVLGSEAAKIALDPRLEFSPRLRVLSTVIDLPLAPLPAPAELEQRHRQYSQRAEEAHRAGKPLVETSVLEIERDWAADALAAHASGSLRETMPCEITALRLGPAALLFASLEVFVETGLAIKAASPFSLTVLCTNANGELGYLPTADAYRVEDYTNPQGLAPKVYGLYAFAEAAEPLFRERASALLQELFAE